MRLRVKDYVDEVQKCFNPKTSNTSRARKFLNLYSKLNISEIDTEETWKNKLEMILKTPNAVELKLLDLKKRVATVDEYK